MAGPDDRDATAPDSGERVHPAWLVVEMAVIAAGVLLVNLWPQWVGGVVLGSADQPWRFLPILTPEIRAYLPWLNLWWGLALALKVMLLRRAGGVVVELGTGSLPLGIRESTDHTSEWITIEPGESLVLYSDGLPEAMSGPDGEAFGFERLAALVGGGGSPAAIHDRILRAFDAHVGDEPLTDDLTLVVLGRS